jgi:hypothetical protein
MKTYALQTALAVASAVVIIALLAAAEPPAAQASATLEALTAGALPAPPTSMPASAA